MRHDEIVVLNGIKFRIEVVSPTYKRMVPVDDPHWLTRIIHRQITEQKV